MAVDFKILKFRDVSWSKYYQNRKIRCSDSCEIGKMLLNASRDQKLLVSGPLANGCEDNWTWNRRDKSHEVRLYGTKRSTAHFHPNWSNGTAGVRGTRSLTANRHYWEVDVSQRVFGTSMMFGIGTKKARLHVDAFVNLLGEDSESWGLSHKGLLWHNGKWRYYTKPFRENEATTIGILYDGVKGTVTFYKDGFSLGVAFTGLNKVQDALYPMVSSTAAKTEMTLGTKRRDFYNLQDRCRSVIIKCVKFDELQLQKLNLPPRLKSYLNDGLNDVHEACRIRHPRRCDYQSCNGTG